jgi:hypothetical protein
MSLSAASTGERPIADQMRVAATGTTPPARRLIPKADATLIPEAR